MTIEKAKMYLNELTKLGFSMCEFGDTNWFFGESKKKEYVAHVILEDDKEFDFFKNKFSGRVRIWNAQYGNQVEIPELEDFTMSQLDTNSLRCRKCEQLVVSTKQLVLVNFDEALCKNCSRNNK